MKQLKVQKYTLMDTQSITDYKALKIATGNGTQAIRIMQPYLSNPADRAYQVEKRIKQDDPVKYVDNKLQELSVRAVDRVGELIESDDERIATINSHYSIDQTRGKATQKNINLNSTVNIQDILE